MNRLCMPSVYNSFGVQLDNYNNSSLYACTIVIICTILCIYIGYKEKYIDHPTSSAQSIYSYNYSHSAVTCVVHSNYAGVT